MVDATRRAWSEFVRIDPSNAISWNNLAVSHFIKGNILEAMGRPADAAANWRSTQDLEAQGPANLMLKNSLGLHASRLALLEAQRGRRREAEAALALGASHNAWVSENAPEGSWDRLSRPAFRKIWPVAVADALGDHRAALEQGRVAAPELDRLKPSVPSAGAREYAFARLILHNAMADVGVRARRFCRRRPRDGAGAGGAQGAARQRRHPQRGLREHVRGAGQGAPRTSRRKRGR